MSSNPQPMAPRPSSEVTPLVTRGAAAAMSPSTSDMKNSRGVRTTVTPITPVGGVNKASTNTSWGAPVGLPMRACNDENLVIFRRALGINFHRPTTDGCTLEEGRKTASGIYKAVITEQRLKSWQHLILRVFLNVFYFLQIVIGAVLTALGPGAAKHTLLITILGASNTVIAGVLALIKGQGLPERLRKDEIEFRKVQDWVEETEALLAAGIIGRDRKEVGLLVEVAFKKYNAAKASEENNKPEVYIPQKEDDGSDDETRSAMIKLNTKRKAALAREEV